MRQGKRIKKLDDMILSLYINKIVEFLLVPLFLWRCIMQIRTSLPRRRGSVLVEYGLLVAGVVLTCALAVAVLGYKTHYAYGVMAAILPAAHTQDNKPLHEVRTFPLDTTGSEIRMDSTRLVSPDGVDRFQDALGPGGSASLVVD